MATARRQPLLDLNDPDFSGRPFERFSLDLVRSLPEVEDAHIYAIHGEDQHGIDIHADLRDGRVRTVQCRRVKRFGKPSARSLIDGTTYDADEHEVWCTCGMSAGPRDLLRDTPSWRGRDIEQISSTVRTLPREVGRWLVEDHLGSAARRQFLGPDAELCLVPARSWFERRDRNRAALPLDQLLQGRAGLLEESLEAVRDPAIRVVVLTGRGGLGKTRMLRAIADALSGERVLLLRDGVEVAATLAEETPSDPYTLLVDDAHRRRDLAPILATVFAHADSPTLVLATRPQRLDGLRAELSHAGIAGDAVRELSPMEALTLDEAQALALEELDAKEPAAAAALARLTRDVPALCVLGARLINEGDLRPAELVGHDGARRDILGRFRDELVGRISDQVDPRLVRELLVLLAALQPMPVDSVSIDWLSEQLGCSAHEARHAVAALETAGIAVGNGRRRRIAPDILGDHILHEACVAPDGSSTGRADELAAMAPEWAADHVLANLAELDWTLATGGRASVLDDVKADLGRQIAAAAAWDRSQLLKRLEDAAIYLADWIVALARRVLDSPAADSELGFGHTFTDADARQALVPLLESAGLHPEQTEAVIHILWEIGRDGSPHRGLMGEPEPLAAAKRFGSWELAMEYREAMLRVVGRLLEVDAEAEHRRELPIRLLQPLLQREGNRVSGGVRAISFAPYLVDAEAARPVRDRVRAVLVDACLTGGPRTRSAAAELIENMLRQPHGYFGRSVPQAAIAQWRPEQLALIADVERVMGASDDPRVLLSLRDSLRWHADHSAIRGVKTAARRVLRSHAMGSDELLLRALAGQLGHLDGWEATRRREYRVARAIVREIPDVDALLSRIDAALEDCAKVGMHADPGSLIGAIAERDADWALEAAQILVAAPDRPTARAVGLLLAEASDRKPDRVREVAAAAANASDPALRRIAADRFSRMVGRADLDASERQVLVGFASDDDDVVVDQAVWTARRMVHHDPELARDVILAVPSLANRNLAESVCSALAHDLELTAEDEDRVLDRLTACPDIEHWHGQTLLKISAVRPARVLDHMLARIAYSDGTDYRPVPFEGLHGDPVATQPDQRAPLLRDILDFAVARRAEHGTFDAAILFWSYAAGDEAALDVLAEALTDGSGSRREVACAVLGGAPRHAVLERPAWVAATLEAAPASTLDHLQRALEGSLFSAIKQGVPGKPFPEDLELRDRAREHADAAPPGSRARVFWTAIVRSAEADIRTTLEQDQELDDE